MQLDPRDSARLDALTDSTQRKKSQRVWRVWLVVAVTSLGIVLLGQFDWIHPHLRVAMVVKRANRKGETMRTAVVLFALVITACAHPEYDRQQATAVEPARQVSITCKTGPDCALKWARAMQWVSGHSYFKLRIASDSIITTEGPFYSPAYSMRSAITVNQLPKGDGTSTIIFKSWCANEFGCVPSHEMLLVQFADFVNQP